jgi:hypothetical protein
MDTPGPKAVKHDLAWPIRYGFAISRELRIEAGLRHRLLRKPGGFEGLGVAEQVPRG